MSDRPNPIDDPPSDYPAPAPDPDEDWEEDEEDDGHPLAAGCAMTVRPGEQAA